jgi:hypothetical protein
VCLCFLFFILCGLETPTLTWPRLNLGCCAAEEEEKRKLQKKSQDWIHLFQDMEKNQALVILAKNILFARLTAILLCSSTFCAEEDISPTY